MDSAGKYYIRCMGGKHCNHSPGTCTASSEYQAMLGKNTANPSIGDWQSGMTLRDWFAGRALVGVGQEYLHRNGFHGDTMFQNLAAHSYRIADALLAEREKSL